ncbi:MAG TPA: type II toxin-antitoxin system RelE/ParE family toxin [Burkholderiaceae bacterium]|nr:type II toxin-antitoxin system RelE/ParE family toxin [Burkholderiaceae bacterium]
MARIELAPEIADDLDRIFDHLAQHAVADAAAPIRQIIDAISVLEGNPLIGRPAGRDQRELVIGKRSQGYVALYRYAAAIDTVFVLALRGQREAGYTHE